MEAATPLRAPNVRTLGDRLAIDGLVLEDETLVRLAREREDAGDDLTKLVADTTAIGARVLDREHAGANTEFVKTEFEKVSKEVEAAFVERAAAVSDQLDRQLEHVFGPDNGQLSRALERHFSDGSSTAVQHRVKEVVAELMAKAREDLTRQFSSAEGHNPLADFKNASLAMIKQASDRQHSTQSAMLEKMAALELQVAKLHAERERQLELSEVHERGTAKGRTFEQAVYDAIDQLAQAQGDVCDAVGDLKGATGKVGDVVVGIDGCRGPARGRIVFEAKNSRLSRPGALRELDDALGDRDADFAVLVVPTEDKLPANMLALREYNGDKMVVTLDPEDDSRLALEVGYKLARARVMMSRGESGEVDAAAVRETVERALQAMDDVRRVKTQLTGATKNIEKARALVETMCDRVRSELGEIDALVVAVAGREDTALQQSLGDLE